MGIIVFQPKQSAKIRRKIEIIQGSPSQGGFKAGYQSFTSNSRTPIISLSDMTNIDLDQDNLPRPRKSLVLFGKQPLGKMVGIDTFIKNVNGIPEKWDISMQVIGTVGKIHIRKDGGDWILVSENTVGANSYDQNAIVDFCQSSNKIYVSNGVNAMSYYNINDGKVYVYTTLATPIAPTVVASGLTGTNFTYYVRVSANNSVGESIASTTTTQQIGTDRDQWSAATQYLTITWNSVANATSYNVYIGTVQGEEKYLASTTGLTFKDDGTLTLNAFKTAPAGNSTAGPTLTTMSNKDGQLFGIGDINNPDYLWYDAGSTKSGDFSPFNGGGNVSINSGGDTVPVAVKPFRTGKGDPVMTVLSRGVAGTGKMHHVSFSTTTFDNNVITIPSVQEANGQAGTVSSRAVLEANNSLWYPTGQDFKSTGTSANIQNILSTNSISNDIIPDVRMLNLSVMNKACGIVYENRLYWSLPVGSTENNQIWVKDLSRKGIWIMPWIISAKFIWLSENNQNGNISLCIYDGTNILEFSRSVDTSDNGIPFKTRVAHSGLTWSDSGMTMGAIQEMRFKLLQPKGVININSFGLDEDGGVNTLAIDTFSETYSFTGWGEFDYFNDEFSGDVGIINFTSKQVGVIDLEIDETLNEIGWEITTDSAGCDYYLSSVLTTGIEVPKSYFGS